MRGDRVKVGESCTWQERGRSEREHGVERVDCTVEEGRFQEGDGGHARSASQREVEENMTG